MKGPKVVSNFGTYVNTNLHYLKSLPVNSMTGPFQFYYQQWARYSNASFVPQIHGYRIIFRLRLHDFIDTNRIALYNVQNITFKCYETSKSKSDPSTKLLLTVKISVWLYPTMKILVEVSRRSHLNSEVYQIKNASIQQLIFPVPLDISENAYYKFSYHTHRKHETILQWPWWPPSSKRIYICRDHGRKNQSDSLSCLKCSWTDKLKITTPQELFTTEKKALSSLLDVLYEVSKYSSIVQYRRTHPFERALKRSICSSEFYNWTSKYQRWHSKIGKQISGYNLTLAEQRDIILKLNIRFVVVKTFGSGLADRMTHLIATYLVALLTQRFLLLDETWSDFQQIMRSSLVYQSETIAPWLSQLDKLNTRFGFNVQHFFTTKTHTIGLDRLYKDFDYDKDFPERVLLIKSHVGNVVHTLTSSSSVYANFLKVKLHMQDDNLFGCLYHSLIVPRLSTLVEISSTRDESTQYFLQSLMFPKHPTIGIQIRAGDSYMDEKRPYLVNSSSLLEKFRGYFDCAQNLTNGGIAPLVYLISDSVDLRVSAMMHWPFPSNNNKRIQVIASSKPAKHIRYTSNLQIALRTAIFEIFLFSLCDTHIITTDSGFGRFAAFASLQRRPFYSFNQWEHPFCAIGEGQVTFMRAGHQWSGV